jgi:hypothetical protein
LKVVIVKEGVSRKKDFILVKPKVMENLRQRVHVPWSKEDWFFRMNRIKGSSELCLPSCGVPRNPGKREKTIKINSNVDYHPTILEKANVNSKSVNKA